MIVTVTPNPSIDRTLRVPELPRGGLVRATAVESESGGKGVNVARVLAVQGVATIALAPLSASSEAVFRALLDGAVSLAAVPIRGEVRVNLSLVEPGGTVTKVNEPGPALDATELDALLERAVALAVGADWVVGSGSLPPGAPSDLYARLAARLGAGVRLAVDADGAPLEAAVTAGIALAKPNHAELERLVGRSLPTLGDVLEAAAGLLRTGVSGVLVSLGADGAVYVDAGGATHAEASIDDLENTVGAGDALLAGFLAAGADAAALVPAVAWSVAACRSPGTRVRPVEPRDLTAVVVHPAPDPARRLAA